MRLSISVSCWIVLGALPSLAGPPEVLNCLPRQADLALVIDRPRLLLEKLAGLGAVRQVLAIDAVREQFDSTNARRFEQLIAHVEAKLGRDRWELLERLTGGGLCVGARFEGDKSGALLIARATDEDLLERALELAAEGARSELERRDQAGLYRSAEHRGAHGYQFGKDFFVGRFGPLWFISNKAEAIRAAVDLAIDGPANSFGADGLAASGRAMMPDGTLAWFVARTERLHQQPAAREAYAYPKGDLIQLVLFQGVIDVIGKAPFVAGGLSERDGMVAFHVRTPAGRDATPRGLALHLPPDGEGGAPPLLEPRGAIMSWSFYLDLGKLWDERDRLLTERTRQDIEKGEKDLGRFLGGRRLHELLTGIGPRHRFVMATQKDTGYNRVPDQPQPAYAFVSDVRGPAYPAAMNAILRTTALALGSPVKLKFREERIGDVTLVTYRFAEDVAVEGDAGGSRFNFSPCFARVGDHFLVASTVELGRELVGLLGRPAGPPAPETVRLRFYSEGAAELIRAFEDQLLTQTILDRAVPVAQARDEANRLIDFIQAQGHVELDVDYRAREMRFDIRLRPKAK
jgi:hypothetical protein